MNVPSAAASEVVVAGDSCTVIHTPAEHEEVLALTGVFAANWSAEILRDIPTAGEDMATARSWHADKTSEELDDMPDHVRAAVDRVNLAGQRVGYRDDEATAPLRVLVDRNDQRAAGITWQTFTAVEARRHMAAARDTGAPALLSGTRENLSVPADESWRRAWERTPGARAEADASHTELRMCIGQTSGTVDRITVKAMDTEAPLTSTVLGLPTGRIHNLTVLRLLEEVTGLMP
ncbi:hypothetical protein EAH68_01175 [Corynebacterium hylobatis]|uniref:Uncharacterized protein n=1 Tax=Corynebacterium hylobatis TaxID=1859290 RepID=A0A430I2E5_9CORY|nr:hypothetical protein [Corynebacterium hylobatis]RSZ66190.1 hypothetical protein EAH68_01175 [Corynebacterium hylobatis]